MSITRWKQAVEAAAALLGIALLALAATAAAIAAFASAVIIVAFFAAAYGANSIGLSTNCPALSRLPALKAR